MTRNLALNPPSFEQDLEIAGADEHNGEYRSMYMLSELYNRSDVSVISRNSEPTCRDAFAKRDGEKSTSKANRSKSCPPDIHLDLRSLNEVTDHQCYLSAITNLFDVLPHLQDVSLLNPEESVKRRTILDAILRKRPVTETPAALLGFPSCPLRRSGLVLPKEKFIREPARVGIVDAFDDQEINNYQFNVGPYFKNYPRVNSWPYRTGTLPIEDRHGSKLFKFLQKPTTATTRVIIVEDLSTPIIDVLGSIWNLDPEFFAEHLHYKWDICDTWNTSGHSKPYFSVRWCRPSYLTAEGAADVAQHCKDDDLPSPWGFLETIPGMMEKFVHEYYPFIREGQNRMSEIWRQFYVHRNRQVAERHGRISGAWEEHVSIYFIGPANPSFQKHNTILILTDPFAALRWKTNKTGPWRAGPATFSDSPRGKLVPNNRVRLSAYATRADLKTLDEELIEEYPTGHLLWHWLQEDRLWFSDPLKIFTPVHQIIERDCRHNLLSIKHTMWETQDVVLTEQDIGKKFYLRQWIIAQAQDQLRLIERCLVRLQEGSVIAQKRKVALFSRSFGCMKADNMPLMEALRETKSLISEAQNAISSRVSMLEGDCQLAEATAVTRLTELAFVFIPLSFSASLYGMQVKVKFTQLSKESIVLCAELNQELENRVSLTTWLWTAVLAVAASYLVRILVRSRVLQFIGHLYITLIRRHKHLSPESTIPSTSYISWIWDNQLTTSDWFSPVMLYLIFPSIFLPLLWSKDLLPIDAKIAWTIFVFVLILRHLFFLVHARRTKRIAITSKEEHPKYHLVAFFLAPTLFDITGTLALFIAVPLIWEMADITHEAKLAITMLFALFPVAWLWSVYWLVKIMWPIIRVKAGWHPSVSQFTPSLRGL